MYVINFPTAPSLLQPDSLPAFILSLHKDSLAFSGTLALEGRYINVQTQFFFQFSAHWHVQTSNGSMFLDVDLLPRVCCIPRSSSSPVIFALVFPSLFYPPFVLLLFLFE